MKAKKHPQDLSDADVEAMVSVFDDNPASNSNASSITDKQRTASSVERPIGAATRLCESDQNTPSESTRSSHEWEASSSATTSYLGSWQPSPDNAPFGPNT